MLVRKARVEVKAIVHWLSEILLATKIALGRLHRCVSQQELNLLQLPATAVTQLSTGSPQVVGSNVLQPCAHAAGPDHIPHHILRDTLPPYLVRSGHGPEDSSLSYPGGRRPFIERGFDPLGNGNGTDVASLANQIHYGPVPLTHLDLMHLQTD